MSFSGLRVLSLESRRAKEIEALILREGGVPFVAPSVRERALEDCAEAVRFVERLEAGDFDLVIFTTGAGLGFLREAIGAQMPVERLASALSRAAIVSRGPKPLPILRELGVRAAVVVPEPNTWKEIVAAVASRPERSIAVQEYGRPNLDMCAALERLGASVTRVPLYRWELPDDKEPLREAARRLASGACDVVLFTSAIQLDHLMQVACELSLEVDARRVLATAVAIASVGPVMTEALESYALAPDIVPQHPKMGALVKAASEMAETVLKKKRSRV